MERDPSKRASGRIPSLLRRFLASSALAALAGPAVAAVEDLTTVSLFRSSEVITFSVLIGVISAAMISAVWLIRQRGNIETDNRELTAALADANHRISRFQALIADKNRRIVVWEGLSDKAEFLGQLPPETGAPQDDRDFLAFGRWIKPQSSSELEKAIETLRLTAQSFDLVVETTRGEIIEAQGRVSGGRAFVRFVALNNLRAELAEVKLERDRLHSSLSSLHTLLDAIDLPVWQRGTDGSILWVNEAYSDAVEAANPSAAVKESRELLATVAREKIRAASTYDSPYRDKVSTVVRGNRTFFDVVDTKSTTGSAGMAINVSDVEAVREELNRTLKSHAETLDHLATPVAIFDGSQRLQFYNQAFQSLWDLDMAFLERKPDNGEILDRLRASGKLPEQLNWKQWKDSALAVYQAIETQSDLWHLPNGQTLRVFATARPQGGATWVFENLTEKVDLETRYNTLVQVQGETIDHLSEGVAVFGPDGRIKLSNPAFRALWGVSEMEVMPGTHIRAIEQACAPSYDLPDGWKRFSHLITSFDDERPSCQGILELRTGLILDFAVIPLPNAQTMLTFVNITDSARVERALTEKNDALQMADHLKNDFVQHVSYELRSPLTNIIGFADLLKTPAFGTLTERQSEYVDHISTSSSLLLTIVNDILDLATVDAGIVELDLSEINLTDFLDEVSLQMADRLQESAVTLQIDAPDMLGLFVADHQRLKQILIKLLTNAANFAPDGSTIGLKCRRDGSDFVFSVTDSGAGIPQDILDTVFNRFESHGQHGGAGLGLSIVESFVSLHHGKVEIRSREGEGTEVTCRIPSGELPKFQAAE
ncbi:MULTISPECIES: PAS domain-containing sensor histidine kinase [unclassified Rhizobium]|uniref:sensor histidine kinase n=1 Tax=unclassified Rhizobium TaxID=2613769 RepID=UPI000714E527|nr:MULTISPECIES: PAS domain-containing sensor histidine kinase [unclassified Rhizobium]KQS87477.1 alkaline phosphatase [Rhizobium sp. Leaf391]KQT06896.1 alkaline phosphatase [Rhizobium sp. Leaf386]KQT95039.1 alkaline phosphatase [Rhizobium sp. Leaf453]